MQAPAIGSPAIEPRQL